MSGDFTNSKMAQLASSLASLIIYASSSEKVAKYLVRKLNESFDELKTKEVKVEHNLDLVQSKLKHILK